MEASYLKTIVDNDMSFRFGHTFTLVSKGKDKAKAVLFGGVTGADGHFSINSDTFVYYITSQKWLKLKRKNNTNNNTLTRSNWDNTNTKSSTCSM